MRRWVLGMAAVAATASAAGAQGNGEAAIRAIEQAQESAWNAHDIAAYVRPLSADAQFVTAFGLWWHDRDETQRKMGYAFRTLFAQSRLHLDTIEVTSLSPEIAVAHIGWTLEGAKRPDGGDAGTVHGIQSQTLRLAAGTWQIVSAQDTLVLTQEMAAQAEAAQPATTAPASTTTPAAAPAKERRCLVATKSGTCLVHH